MTVQEFSDQFDVLYNNITSNQAPGLNEYEKSVFLTKGQEELVKNYFSPKGNPKQDGFDDSPKRQSDFANIIRTSTLNRVTASQFDPRSIAYKKPEDLFLSLNEQLTDGMTPITVIPISYAEYDRLMSKPYKYPPKYQAWRLTTNNAAVEASIVKVSQDFAGAVLTTASKYGKPVRFIVNTTSGDSMAPVIDVSENIVTITILIGRTLDGAAITNTVDYWRKYLGGRQLSPYLEPFDGVNYGVFPSVTIDSSWDDDEIYDLTNPGGTSEGTATIFEIIGRFASTALSYRMRYVKRPDPIILVDLRNAFNDLTIQGKWSPMTSELSEELHEEILQRAVELAKVAWTSTGQDNTQAVIQTGQRSE